MSADRLQPIDASPEAEVVRAVDELALKVEAVRLALEAAARHAEPFSSDERTLRRLLDERDEASMAVGRAVARLLASGGTIEPRRLPPLAPVPETDPDEIVTVADVVPEPTPPAKLEPAPQPTPEPTQARGEPALAVTPAPVAEPPPPPKPEPPPAPKGPPAPAATLVALLQKGLGPSWEAPPARDRKSVAGLLEQIGRPTRVRDAETARRVTDHVAYLTNDLDSWLRYPQSTQQALVGLLSSLARHVQDESPADTSDPTLKSVFSRLSRWSKLYRPGFVPGLSRNNPPNHGSWLADAEHWWNVLSEDAAPAAAPASPSDGAFRRLEEQVAAEPDPASLARAVQEAVDAGVSQSDPRLVKLLLPRAEDLALARGLKTLKSGLRAQARVPLEEEETLDRPFPIPEDWPFRPLTVEKRAVVLGGDRRPMAADRMRETFGFATCEWEETDPRRVGSLADRVRSGGIDLVILLRRFLGHSELEVVSNACRDSGVPFCVVDTGYGVTQVRLAIERYLQAHVT
jgi:hypothetical protein